MPDTLPSRRSFNWSLLALALLVILFGTVGFFFLRAQAQKLAPAAYLLPLDTHSSARLGWRTQRIPTAQTVLIGKTVDVAAGAHFILLHLDGEIENLTGPVRVPSPQVAPPAEVDFLRSPLREVVDTLALDPSDPPDRLRVTSPFGLTRFLNPTIMWEARAGANYDVVVHDPADEMSPVRIKKGIRPPITLGQLETPQTRELIPDRIYEVVIRESGNQTVTGGARFLTSPEADLRPMETPPYELLTEAVQAMAKKPTRTGDAWLALSLLPGEWANTELAIRLRLRVTSELGLPTEFAQAQQAARRLLRW